MLRPLGRDKGRHRYRPIASCTEGYRAFEHVTLLPEFCHLAAQPDQLGTLVLAQPAIAALPLPAVLATQFSSVPAWTPRSRAKGGTSDLAWPPGRPY